jgi:hypothetical protein
LILLLTAFFSICWLDQPVCACWAGLVDVAVDPAQPVINTVARSMELNSKNRAVGFVFITVAPSFPQINSSLPGAVT